MSRRVAGAEGDTLAEEVMPWIEANLGVDYPWPGNYRELEQCVKNMLIRGNYRPARVSAQDPVEEFASQARAGKLSADELLTGYTTIAYSRTGSYEETARRLGLDRRTVKAKVDSALLDRLRRG
jgi:transcriptional regulator of acetoin/glycerol metabolism